jgi:fibronectin-binding autotransporter adhesin
MFTQIRSRQLSFTSLAVLLAFSTLLLITSITFARSAGTIVVNPGGSIQAAIDAATPGDTILINAGVYTESLTLSKAVSLTGVNSTTVIINAPPNQRVLTVTGATISNSVIISGLTFANGQVADSGGGVWVTVNALPIIENVSFVNNFAGNSGGGLAVDPVKPITLINITAISNTATREGGGVYAKIATILGGRFIENHSLCPGYPCGGGGAAAGVLTINGTKFAENTATHSGGGVYGSSVIITAAQFVSNYSAYEGGGIWAFSSLVIANSDFISNSADSEGGGVYVAPTRPAQIINTEFRRNTAGDGGGAVVGSIILSGGRFEGNHAIATIPTFSGGGGLSVYDSLDITGTEFIGNSAYRGGGILHHGTSTYGANAGRIVNVLFSQNTAEVGGAAFWTTSPSGTQILFTTIASPTLNGVSAIAVATGTVGLTNTIIANHAVGIERINGDVYEDYNLFFSNTTNISGTLVSGGTHDVFGNPNFVDPALGNYHIISPSAAIDAGVNAGVATDLDGLPRPFGAGHDIGAYEYINFTTRVYLPLVRR